MKKTGQLVQMIIQIVFIILNVTLVKSQATTLRPPQISTLYSTSYSYVISSMIISIPAGNQTSSSSSKNETISNGPIIPKKSSSGLSTGAICAIAIPTIAALLGVAAVAALFNGAATPVAGFTAPSLPEPNFIDTSLTKFQIPNQIPIQQPQPVQIIEQPQPVQIIEQPQIIQPEPIKVVPRVDYPVNRVIEPPRVNNVFQQNIAPQQVQMVPIQEVQMVPVQEVQMIPVEQVEMVPVQQMATIPGVNGVPLQQIVPMNQAFPIGQVAEAVPQVTEASISSAAVEIIPQGQLGNQLISSTSQLMPQSQVLPTQVLPTVDHGVQPLPSQYL
jgi:hypothetical protein